MTLVDTHCHLSFPPLSENLEGVLARARAAGVDGVVAPAYDLASWSGVAVAAAWMAQVSTPDLLDFVTYEITLVSLPTEQETPAPAPPPEEELVVETPVPVVADEPPPVVEERRREEERPRPTPTPPPDPVPEKPGAVEPSSEAGREEIAVRMEGLRRDYPQYWSNIITQIRRCLRFSGSGRLETTILFSINRDGTVDTGNLRFVRQSGNTNFDYAAMGAVECAGQGRFGPLPEGLGLDRLPILFTFTPSGGG